MVLKSLDQINGITERVQSGAETIKAKADESTGAAGKLVEMSVTMQREIAGIVTQVQEVSESAQAARSTVDRNNEGLDSLYGAIARFKM
jgi:methyl-accepting chemotaxis protein